MAAGGKTKDCWVVIADGARVRVVVRAAHGRGYQTVRAIESAAAHKSSVALGSDRPGRATERATGLRHAIEPRTDRHIRAKLDFAALVADTINRAGERGEFGSLVLVAPARQLAAIRKHLQPAALASLTGTLAKDLTKTPDAELPAHLAAAFAAGVPDRGIAPA